MLVKIRMAVKKKKPLWNHRFWYFDVIMPNSEYDFEYFFPKPNSEKKIFLKTHWFLFWGFCFVSFIITVFAHNVGKTCYKCVLIV